MARTTRGMLLVLLCLAGVEFTVRGPVRWLGRGHERRSDLTGPYLSARAWVRGLNPYTSDVFWTMAAQVEPTWGEGRSDSADDFESRTPYPLTAFVVLAPLSLLSWTGARIAGMAVMVLLVLAAIGAMAWLPGLRDSPARREVFIALALALAPVQSSISVGNPVAMAVALTAIAACADVYRRHLLAGALFAIAVCLKPPIAAPLLAYAALRGRWRTVAAAAVVAGGIAAVGVMRLRLAGTPWLADYVFNNSLLLADHGGDIIRWSEGQSQFINLQYLGSLMFDRASTANNVAIGVSGALLLVWLALFVRRGDHAASEFLEIGALATISLLPIYHRIYDAALLVFPLAWMVAEWRQGASWWHRLAFLLVIPFLVPGTTLIEMAVAAGRIPRAMTGRWWWNALVVPHQVWALTALSVVLLVLLAGRDAGRSAGPDDNTSAGRDDGVAAGATAG